MVCAYPRTDSPFLRSCPASGSASSFLPASALVPHEALRPHGEEDARCVQPTSATRTTCVHPYLVSSWLATATFAAWTSRGVWAQRDLPGDRRFHDLRDRFGGSTRDTSSSRPRLRGARAWAFSSHGASDAIVPLTLLSPSESMLPPCMRLRACFLARSSRARSGSRPNRQGHRDHQPVKGDGS